MENLINKLTYENLNIYLPFNIKVLLSDKGKFNLDEEQPSGNANNQFKITNVIFDKEVEIEIESVNCDYGVGFIGLDEITLILHPLSDLIKEIEHNGEKFVPFKKLSFDLKNTNLKAFYQAINDKVLSYGVMQQLISWHFDIDDLIGKDYAVDINTLNK